MLLRVVIKNFLSFDDEVQFDMFPNMKRTQLSEHVYMDSVVPVLKQAAIYGSNGAGKSNLVKAMEFVRAFATDKNFVKGIDLKNFFYLLKENAATDPICISVEFESRKKTYLYEVEIGPKAIEKEALWETHPRELSLELVFERKKNIVEFAKDATVDEAVKEATKKMLSKNSMSSLIALNTEFPIFNDARCGITYKWFKDQLEIIGVSSMIPTLIDILRADNNMMDFAKKLVYNLEVGVRDVRVTESDFEQWASNHIELARELPGNLDKLQSLSMSLNANNTPVLSINVENGVRKVYQMIFDNIGKKGYVGQLDSSSQSDGTLRALTLLPALYYATKKGKTVFVDEINYCLSPTMVKGIVEFFAKTKDSKGQLIFTTHDTQLLDESGILRSDEIWFVDKRDGGSILYSHNDFKEHGTLSKLRGYNEGRYGAIRFVKLYQENG